MLLLHRGGDQQEGVRVRAEPPNHVRWSIIGWFWCSDWCPPALLAQIGALIGAGLASLAQIGAKGLPTGLEQGDEVVVWGDGGVYEYLLGSFGSSGSPQESSPISKNFARFCKKIGGSCNTNIIVKAWIQQLYKKGHA